jgi:hypothetical protein
MKIENFPEVAALIGYRNDLLKMLARIDEIAFDPKVAELRIYNAGNEIFSTQDFPEQYTLNTEFVQSVFAEARKRTRDLLEVIEKEIEAL